MGFLLQVNYSAVTAWHSSCNIECMKAASFKIRKQRSKYHENIMAILDQANSTDYIDGETWYKKARLDCYEISRKYSISFRKTCAILSALSPRNRWERNKKDLETIIMECQGLIPYGKYGTYGNMVKKAKLIYFSKVDSIEMMLKLLNGPKIKSFFLNIYDYNSDCVTVDSWIQLIALGEYLAVDKRPSLSKVDYNLIANSIKLIAIEKNVSPPVLQAVLWTSFKRLTKEVEYN